MAAEPQEITPRIISSQFLDSSDTKDNLAIVVLNWKLPCVTPLLLEKGNNRRPDMLDSLHLLNLLETVSIKLQIFTLIL